MQPDRNASSPNRSGVGVSVLIHAAVLVGMLGVWRGPVRLAPYKLPGTSAGVRLLTYYSPGSTKLSQQDVLAKAVEKQKPETALHAAHKTPKVELAAAMSTDPGVGKAGLSGLGDGNITIALQKYFPYPTPSLATLPHGTAGDVILDAVIDEHGKIAELTLLQGLGPAIDDAVIQTVNQWTYTPAMKNGVPVASVQELHFHYERRG